MTRSIQLHPFSMLVGLGIAVMAMVTMAQSDIQGPQMVEVVKPVQVAPHPRDMVQIREGTPYVVPQGRILMITALGSNNPGTSGGTVLLAVDGLTEVAATPVTLSSTVGGVGNGSSVKSLPQGLSVSAGSTVAVVGGLSSSPDDARAWGYLVDA